MHYEAIYLVAFQLFVLYFEVIVRAQGISTHHDRPGVDNSFRITDEQSTVLSKSNAVRVDLIEEGRTLVGYIRVPVAFRIVDEAESLVFDAKRIIGACMFAYACANLSLGCIQDRKGHQGSDIYPLPADSLHEPEPHFLIEAARCNYQGPVIG